MSEWQYNYQNNIYLLKDTSDQKGAKMGIPKRYRVDLDTGMKAFNHEESMFHNKYCTYQHIEDWDTKEEQAKKDEHNKQAALFHKYIVSSSKQERSNFDNEEDYQTYLFHWINYNVPLSRLYWKARSGDQLEFAVSKMLKDCGYDPEVTGQRDDKGIDLQLLVTENKPKDPNKEFCWIAVQCKGLSSLLGPSAIREIIGVREIGDPPFEYKRKYVAVICPLGFTKSAKKLAYHHNVGLFDANVLVEICHGNVDPFFHVRTSLLNNRQEESHQT